MSKATILKEAIKTGLAFAAVFGIAMQLGWMNPYWAGWAVAVIALPTAGEAIRKGTLRVVGTIPGCLAALAIQALAPQERWLFMILTCAWAFFTSYLMVSRPKDSYLWAMACYVCLIILLSDVDSSENMFESAVFRTVETVMGVVVYTLISVFLWPRTNLGAIKQSSAALASALRDVCRAGRDTLVGEPEARGELRGAAGQGRRAPCAVREGADRRRLGELRGQPGAPPLGAVPRAVDGLAGNGRTMAVRLRRTRPHRRARGAPGAAGVLRGARRAVRRAPRAARRPFDGCARAPGEARGRPGGSATAVRFRSRRGGGRAPGDGARRRPDGSIGRLRPRAGRRRAVGGDAASVLPTTGRANRSTWLPVPDRDHLRRAAFVAATTGVGFLIWILFDPPGHSGWFQLSGTIALLVAAVPQMRASKLIAPVAVTSAICLAIYVLVMPQLSSFLGLGTLLFLCMFLNHYFLTGMARLFSTMAILNMLQIQNQQVYSFYVMVNVFLFLVMAFTFLFVMSYTLGSPRPEKAMLGMLDRFFRSAEFLMSSTGGGAARVPLLDGWRIAFHQRQLRSIPAQLAAWGAAVDLTRCPGATPERLQALVVSLQALVYRIEQLMEAGGSGREAAPVREARDELATWHAGLEELFGRWARRPEAEPVATLDAAAGEALAQLETRFVEVVNEGGRDLVADADERFFRLLGGYRGVVGGGPRLCRRRAVHQLVPMAGGEVLMTRVACEFTVGGVYLPPLLVAGNARRVAGVPDGASAESLPAVAYFFYPPLVFVAMTVLYTVAVGTCSFPSEQELARHETDHQVCW